MVNELRVGFNRLNVDFGGNSLGTVPAADAVDQAVTSVTFRTSRASYAIGTATNLPQSRIVNTWQAQDNWNFVMGKHTFKAGVNYTFQRSPNIFLPTINGASGFRAGPTPADQSRLEPCAHCRGQSFSLDFREHDTFLYGGDDWKIGQQPDAEPGLDLVLLWPAGQPVQQ